jgi:tetratricopeptide (TPR) repeat protein
VYGTDASLSILPQARTPALARMTLDPWLTLARNYEEAGEWKDARDWYKSILELDPYNWEVRDHLATLPAE